MAHSGCVGAVVLAGVTLAFVGTGSANAQPTDSNSCRISGTVTSSGTPLPGVALTLTTADGRTIESSSTAPDGSFQLRVRGEGELELKAELVAFAPIARAITVAASNCDQRADLSMTLASRAPAAPPEGR